MVKRKSTPKRRKAGRPSLYTEPLAARICRRLAEGETQTADQLLERMATDESLALGAAGNEVVDLFDGAVVNGDAIAATLNIQSQVFAHHGQADEAKVTKISCGRHGSVGRGLRVVRWGGCMIDDFGLMIGVSRPRPRGTLAS